MSDPEIPDAVQSESGEGGLTAGASGQSGQSGQSGPGGTGGTGGPGGGRFVAPPVSRDLAELVQPLDRGQAGTLLLAALGMGVLGNVLIYPDLLGAGSTLWAAALLAGLAWSIRRNPPSGVDAADRGFIGGGKFALRGLDGLFLLALAAALCASWRDAPFLRVCSVLLFFLTAIWIQLSVNGIRLFPAPTVVAAMHVQRTLYAWLLLPVFQMQLARAARRERGRGLLDGTLKGAIIACVLVLFFGALLGRADARFHALLSSFTDANWATWFRHVFWIAAFFGLALVVWTNRPRAHPSFWYGEPEELLGEMKAKGLALARLDLLIPMAALDVLFGAFVIVQLGYFFGGDAYVQETAGVSYAAYARRGFFELAAVAALVLPMQLLFDWWLRNESAGARRAFQLLAAIQSVLLLCILASAAHRMAIYQEVYGLTRLRVYASAGIAWIGMGIVWHALTVLRDRRDSFLMGPMAAAVALFLAVQVMNPDALIARVNIERMKANAFEVEAPADGRLRRQGGGGAVQLDVAYLRVLSLDAAPVLEGALEELPGHERGPLAAHLAAQRERAARAGLRAWSWSRARAVD